jgi:hypothetical protein
MKFIDEDEIIKYCQNMTILISHGGVSSEYLTKLLNIKYHNIILKTKKPLIGALVHYPYPPPCLDQIIYIYGDIYNSILSQITRHCDNAAKLCNDMNYKNFQTIQELLDCTNNDPFNIEKQILRFMNDKTTYPIILLKYGFDVSLIPILIKITNNYNFKNYKFKSRNSKLSTLNIDTINKLLKLYWKTNLIIDNSPELIVRFPNMNYKLSDNDVIKYETMNNFPGKRIKHYKKIKGYEIYNERDCENKYGCLRIRKCGEDNFDSLNFSEQGINIKCNYGGVEDFRYFIYNNYTYVLMNGRDNNKDRNMYLYNVDKKIFCKLFINNYDISKIRRQKNWTPYVHLNEVFFIYGYDELCVIQIKNMSTGECECIKGDPFNFNVDYEFFGSTPLIQWNYPNYIGFVHTRNPYYSCPIIFDVEKLKVKHIGEPIIFKNPKGIESWRNKIVQFSYDLNIDKENIILSVEFEDKCPTLVYLDYISFCKAFSV